MKKLSTTPYGYLVTTLMIGSTIGYSNVVCAASGDFYALPQTTAAHTSGMQGEDYALSPRANDNIRGTSLTVIKSFLAKMVLAAKNYTPELREAISAKKAAQADVEQAKGQRLPQVDVGLQSNPYQFGSGERVEKRNMTNGLNISMTTNVIDWGYNSKNIDSKEFTAKANDNYYYAQLEDTAYQVCYQLAELAKQKLITQLSQEYVERMQRLVNMIGDISKVDTGRVSELTQAQARLMSAQAAKESAASKVRDAEIALRKLTGKTQFNGLPHESAWDITLQNPDKLQRSVGSHPAIQQAQNQALSAFEEAKAVKAGNLPKVNWVVNKTIPVNNDSYEESWQTYLNVSWGLYRGGSANAQEEAAAMRAEAAQQKIDEQRVDLASKVQSSIHNAQTMFTQAAQYRQLVSATNRVRRDFFEQWRQLNKRTLLDVLTAESDYYNNQVNEVTTRFNAYSSIFGAYANAGKLTQWLNVK
jgi:adhesin transport system outer membrane protein